jgi:hypothetical protein
MLFSKQPRVFDPLNFYFLRFTNQIALQTGEITENERKTGGNTERRGDRPRLFALNEMISDYGLLYVANNSNEKNVIAMAIVAQSFGIHLSVWERLLRIKRRD